MTLALNNNAIPQPEFFFNLGPACSHFAVFLSSAGHFSTKNNQAFQELLTYSKILKKNLSQHCLLDSL